MKKLHNMSTELIPKTKKVDLDSLTRTIEQDTLHFARDHGFTENTMDLLSKASEVSQKAKELEGAINDLRAAQEAYIVHAEGQDHDKGQRCKPVSTRSTDREHSPQS